MNDKPDFEFRINGNLYGLQLGKREVILNWSSMETGWECEYRLLTFSSNAYAYAKGVTKSEAIENAIAAILVIELGED